MRLAWAWVAAGATALGLGCGGAPPWRAPPGGELPVPPVAFVAPATRVVVGAVPPAASREEVTPPVHASLPPEVAGAIDAAVTLAIAEAKLPGGVVVIGRRDAVLFERAYGSRSLQPTVTPMTQGTVFDLASLTKPVATAASILALVDRGQLDLDAPLRTYLPELGAQGRATLRQALTHEAGFPADTPLSDYDAGIDEAIRRIAKSPLRYEPGTDSHYSDVGFLLLGAIVERVSRKDLATFAHEAVFAPLGMEETAFVPEAALRARAAPTEKVDGRWLVGEVHDPRARLLGGVAGHAGLFSTAADLTRFAQAMLRGTVHESGAPVFLSPHAMQAFVAPHDIPHGVRALGWDVRSRYSSNRGASLSPRAFGHGGYTGTSLWIDPTKDLFVLLLSNRVHPDGHGAVNPLAGSIADLAATAVGEGEGIVMPACDAAPLAVATGLDVLDAQGFAPLRGAHVGLITNAAGRTRDGRRDVDALAAAAGVHLVAIFAPEHGLASDQDAKVADDHDAATGLPVFSLYGEHFAPTDEALAGIDTLVFDLPDVGTRFFTYASTLHRALEAAARHGLRFVVLDRPDPIDGLHVEGPVLASARLSFVNHAALPVRHGLTVGELALLFDATGHLGTALEVVRASGWTRERTWPKTGLAWLNPSPNLRSPAEALLYPGIGLLEATNVAVGRGTDTPFEVLGAPWIDGVALTAALGGVSLPGVRFTPTTFTPTASKHHGQRCSGLRFTVTDAWVFSPVRLGIALAVALHALYPGKWDEAALPALLASKPAADAIARGIGVDGVIATWDADLARFKAEREKYLLYPTRSCPAATGR